MSKIRLKSSHIYIESALAKKVFREENYAYAVYVAKQHRLLITPVSSQWFVKMHKPAQFLLKSRTLKGDKTLALREILIDNELDETDRDLDFEVVENTSLLKIKL